MDGFDDLLATSSRSVLEENPFEDPFAKRSNSPDPWASFTRPSASEADLGLHIGQDGSATPTGSFVTAEHGEHGGSGSSSSVDPLDSAAQTTDYDDEPLASRRSRGFMESIPSPTTFSEIATIRPTLPEELEPSVPAASYKSPSTPPSSSFATPATPTRHPTNSTSASSITPPSPSTSTSGRTTNIVSPLEQPSGSNLGHSFASLALGGESVGGWQAAQSSPWPHETSSTRVSSNTSAEDSDDDKPIRQTWRPTESAEPTPTVPAPAGPPVRNDNSIQPVFTISVEDPQKVGDPIRSFTMYTVHTKTTSPLFQKSSFSVLRRYSDFLWLYETLSINNPGVVVPPVPEKNPFGRFDDRFVRQRRFALQKCIQKIANHPVLGKDTDLKLFLESDGFTLDIKHRKAEIAHERGGLMTSIGQTIAGPRFFETDEWFDRQKAYLDSLESQLRGLVKAIELVSKHRAELAVATGEFAQTVEDLSSSDLGKPLSQSLAGLADIERKAQVIQNTQSQQDMTTILGTVDEYARLINSVRLAFSSRIRTYHAWQNADNEVRRVKMAHERNRAQGRLPPDRLGHSLSLIGDAERRALEAKHEFDYVSKLIKSEVARFERERIEDFKSSLQEFLEGMISRQMELIKGWETYQQSLLKKVGGGGRPLNIAVPLASP